MTIQQHVQEISQVFPKLLQSQIIKDLDVAQKKFIEETFYLETYYSLNGLSTNTSWLLPHIFNVLKEILLYDINGDPLYLSDYQLDYEIEFGYLFFKSVTSSPLISIPTAIAYIYIGFYVKAQPLTSLTDTYSVNDEHVDGIVAKVYKDYYAKFPVEIMVQRGVTAGEIIHTRDFNAVKYWASVEVENRVMAKRWVNRKNDTTTGSAINYGSAGNFELPLRTRQIGAGTLQPLGNLFSKYFKFTATNGIPIVSNYSFGWTTIPTVSYSVGTGTHPDVFTITSSDSEFTNTMVANSNNSDFHVNSWGANSIQLAFGDATGTVTVTIIEWL